MKIFPESFHFVSIEFRGPWLLNVMDNVESSKRRLTLLVLRAQAGDRDAADRLMESHQAELFGYLAKMLGNNADAEDALQQTFMQAFRKIKWLREPGAFRPWIFRVASRKALRIIQQSKRRKEMTNAEFIDAAEGSPNTSGETPADLIERIPDWLERLTPKGREALMLHYLKGFTCEEVAEILDIPLGTVKSRISYSLACIRKNIQYD